MGKKKVLTGFMLFAVLTLTLTNLSNIIENTDVEGLEPNLASLLLLLKHLFRNSALAFAIGYLRNLLGFLENWIRARYSKSEIEYELCKLGETWAKYQAGVLAISLWLPTPAAAAITFLTDLITSSIIKLAEKNKRFHDKVK